MTKEKSTEINIRLMTPEDAQAVTRVEKACFKFPWSRESFWQEAIHPDTIYLVIEVKGEIQGYMGVWHIGDEAHITNVAIHPDYQHLKLGTKMVKTMLEICQSEKIRAATLEVRPSNEPALNLYKKFGFRSVGNRPNYYEDGEDACIMWLTDLGSKDFRDL